jgi:hypothetical protein
MSGDTTHEGETAHDHPGRRSSGAEGAATRWGQQHPEDDVEHPVPLAPPEDEDIVPNRHSASAEAAALRWHESHPDDEG